MDRRPTDDGGHYIAARFNGPSDWFNHFAQDASFNRGAYRALEDRWAKELRAGRRIFVEITPHYQGASTRPSSLTVEWRLDAERFQSRFPMREGVGQMEPDKLDQLGPMMNEIGVEGTQIVGGDPDGLYIFAEFDEGVVDAAVFKDEGDAVRYFDPTDLLFDLLSEAWKIESPDSNRRWAVMHYEVRGTAFHVELTYPEELDPIEDMVDRRRVALKKRYGDKMIIYPPLPDHAMELK